MNDHDVEQRLRDGLSATADAAVPDHRLPPHAAWLDTAPRRRRWLAPLAVAASVVVIAAVVYAGLWHRPGQTPVAGAVSTSTETASPSVTSAAPSQPAPSTPSSGPATTTASTPGTSNPSTTSGGTATTASAAGASLVIPPGWSIRPHAETPDNRTLNPTWCIDPDGSTACVVVFTTLTGVVDSDAPSGEASNSEYCGVGGAPGSLEYTEPTLGGRAAEYRYWHYDCRDGSKVDVAQYTVVTPQGYILWSEKASPQVRDVLMQIANASTLPPATSTVRLYDHGVLRSVVPRAGGGWDIAVDRVIYGRPNSNPATYTYRVSAADAGTPWAQNLTQLIGQSLSLHTDGTVVTDILPD